MTDPRDQPIIDAIDWFVGHSREEWEATHHYTESQRQLIADHADGLAVLMAEIAAYNEARGANGCGDCGHEAGMKAAARARKKVRRALGYSYP